MDAPRGFGLVTELIVYLAADVAVAVTAFVVGDDGENTVDPFSAEQPCATSPS